MTLPLNSRLSALYDTNGTQKDFSFGFRVFFDPDNGGYGLEVRRQTADGYEVIPKSDYLVLPVEDNSAGVVRFSVAPSAGQQIYIAGKTPTIQQLVLTNFGRYSAESIETQFDFITAIIQEWLSALGEETRQRTAADDILTQYVIQRIDAFVQQVNQNFDDKSQEIEDYIATIMPSFTQALRDEIEAYAVAGMQDAINQTLAESKAEIDDAVARANAAALAAAITGKVYDTPEAGVNPVTGVQNGAYYNVRSTDDDSFLVEYQNVGGVPTPSGKSYPSYSYVQKIAEFTALPFVQGETYSLNERVQLENGDIVKSTVAGNTLNPNEDMAGWVNAEAEQLTFNTVVSTRVDDLESYIVYAEKYGSSLNESIDAINLAFVGKRVRVYVPSDFPVTATVNLNIDCDLDLKSLQVMNDIDVIFEPKIGWNGSTTPCVIDVNYKSCRLGWSMKKALGEISIDRCTFKNIGNQALDTSADSWTGFLISTVDIKKIDLFYPTTINSYVKPNAVIGDNIGVNRNILIEGVFTASSFASNINIYNHTAIDLYTDEDADSLCINTGSSSVLNSMHNIDIYDGFCQNVHKRMYKFMLRQKCKGIRLHGTSIAIAGGDKPYCAMDLYGNGDLVAEGAIYGTGWIIGINSSESTNFMGSTYKANFVMTKTVVDGNQVRALNQTGATASTVELLELSGSGGIELFVTQATHTLKLGVAKYDAWTRAASMTGQCTIDKLDITMVTPLDTVARTPYLIGMGNDIKIKNVTFKSTVTEDQQYLFQTLGFSNIEIEGVTVANGLSGAVMRMVTANNIKLSKVKAPGVATIARCESGGSNLLLNLCTTPISGVTVQQIHTVTPMTNVVELNKLTF